MTYNIGNGLVSPDRLVRFLLDCEADIIGLQEVSGDQATAVTTQTKTCYPHQIVVGSGFSGKAMLSRYPIVGHEWLELSPGRPDLRTSINLPGVTTTVIVAHPLPQRLQRGRMNFDAATVAQIEHLAHLAATRSSTVLLGDFNMTPRHPSYAQLAAAGLIDAHRAVGVGRGATFPLRAGYTRRFKHYLSWVVLPPVARIDYIWHTPDFATLGVWVGSGVGSDHRPVVARLAPGEVAPERTFHIAQ
jgi:endonuclease/exonuclease/phosphatase family metal-dependent hydrolase